VADGAVNAVKPSDGLEKHHRASAIDNVNSGIVTHLRCESRGGSGSTKAFEQPKPADPRIDALSNDVWGRL
jgi:hypothetical protein